MSRYAQTALVSLSCVALAVFGFAQTPAAPSIQHLLIFNGVANGGQPWAAPITDLAGNLYGATSVGGNGACAIGKWTVGCGTVYKVSPPASGSKQWTETLLYQFQTDADGFYPIGGLVFDKAGNLYGTTNRGGASSSCGTLFELTPPASGTGPWTKTIIHNFSCGSDGGYPESGLTFDKAGNIYGTATWGGNCTTIGCNGVVFELTPPASIGGNWTYSAIYAFQGIPDGSQPQSTPIFDGKGNLYGTTIVGGTGIQCAIDENCGTIFRLTPPTSVGGAWTESVLYNFAITTGDAAEPRSGLVYGGPGVFLGVTEWGGTSGRGTVYRLTAPASSAGNWTESVLYSFTGLEGSSPFGAPAIGKNGSIYGLTTYGGDQERGNVFQLTPPGANGDPWTETSLYEFNTFAYPLSGLTLGKGGWLYGVTMGGVVEGTCATSSTAQNLGCGEVFRILP